MKLPLLIPCLFCGLVLIAVLAFTTTGLAQIDTLPPPEQSSGVAGDGTAEPQAGSGDVIPRAALLTERGTQLVERLKQLRRIQERMGTRHPARPDVALQIAEIKEQLDAWTPAPNPFHAPAPSVAPLAIPPTQLQINDEDLRQVVLGLTDEMEALRKRVEALEKAAGTASR